MIEDFHDYLKVRKKYTDVEKAVNMSLYVPSSRYRRKRTNSFTGLIISHGEASSSLVTLNDNCYYYKCPAGTALTDCPDVRVDYVIGGLIVREPASSTATTKPLPARCSLHTKVCSGPRAVIRRLISVHVCSARQQGRKC